MDTLAPLDGRLFHLLGQFEANVSRREGARAAKGCAEELRLTLTDLGTAADRPLKLSDLTPDRLQGFLDSLAPTRRASTITRLRSFFGFLQRKGYVDACPGAASGPARHGSDGWAGLAV
jgi:hypothetical protein